MKPIEQWTPEELPNLEIADGPKIRSLVTELHGFLIALETYETMIEAIENDAETAFTNPSAVNDECADARTSYNEIVDQLLAADEDGRKPTEQEETESDAVIRNLLEQPSVVTTAYLIDDWLRHPPSRIGQLYRTELAIADPDTASDIYTNSMQMAGAVQTALDSLESFADYHPADPFPTEKRGR